VAPGSKTAEFFQIRTQAKTVVYVIDCSGSMGLNGYWEAARKELYRSLDGLPETARFQVILYNRAARKLRIHGRCELAWATRENTQEVKDQLQAVYAEGSTAHVQALQEALQLCPEVIFLLTDGAELAPEQIHSLTLRNEHRSIIHAVQFAAALTEEEASPLQSLAHQNQGEYRLVVVQP
jgi:hypothetical protein